MNLKPKGDEKPFNGMGCNGYSLIRVAEGSIASELPPVNLRLCAKRIWCNNTLSDMIWASGATGLARLSDTQEVLSSSLRMPTKVKFAAVCAGGATKPSCSSTSGSFRCSNLRRFYLILARWRNW